MTGDTVTILTNLYVLISHTVLPTLYLILSKMSSTIPKIKERKPDLFHPLIMKQRDD